MAARELCLGDAVLEDGQKYSVQGFKWYQKILEVKYWFGDSLIRDIYSILDCRIVEKIENEL